LWDFGDGGTSGEQSPIHTYVAEGRYTVKLNITTATGAQGSATKIDYIEVSQDEAIPFFYVAETAEKLSAKTAMEQAKDPTLFTFVDQTDGSIVQRNWNFGDGELATQNDPDIHDVQHIYAEPGSFRVTLIVVFETNRIARLQLPDLLVVL